MYHIRFGGFGEGFIMFIYALRASTLKFFGIILLSVAVLCCLLVLVPHYEAAEETAGDVSASVRYDGVRTNEDRIAFIAQFGYTVASEPVEQCEFTLPEEFDRVLAGYNELQKQQGLDLSRYRKKTVTRYTYTVTSDVGYDGVVYINLLVFRDRVVGCDLATADPAGFVRPLG